MAACSSREPTEVARSLRPITEQLIVIEQEDTGAVAIRFVLQDVVESGRAQPVIIHLTENVEVIVPKPGVTPGIMGRRTS